MSEVITGANGRRIGVGHPTYIVGEIGINHNGSIATALELIQVAKDAGCDAVKFQKRTPEICVPDDQRDRLRETPWGTMTYLEYKKRIEFGLEEFTAVNEFCKSIDIDWFGSPWDIPSADFLEQFSPPFHKVASACITDDSLLRHLGDFGRPVLMSTGMSTIDEVRAAFDVLNDTPVALLQSTSSYPAKPEDLNLLVINALREEFGVPVGYSGHEVGLQTTLAAVALGACVVERHITLSRAMWGTDQAASVEPPGLSRLVRDIRVIESALGDGVKRVVDDEWGVREKLRRH